MMWPLVAYFAFVVFLVAAVLIVSYLLGQRHSEPATGEPFEGGIVSEGSARVRLSVRYYLVAMFFVVFDLEAVFLFAWAGAVRELFYLFGRGGLEMLEPDHHVRHLDAGVVDVILHLDLAPERAQHANEGVAQDCVAQVTDVSGLVRIDVGVLDDGLAGGGGARLGGVVEDGVGISGAIEPDVDVSVARHFERSHAVNFADAFDQLIRDGLRGLLQLASQLEGHGDGEFSESGLLWLFEGDGGVDSKARADIRGDLVGDLFFYDMKHKNQYALSACRDVWTGKQVQGGVHSSMLLIQNGLSMPKGPPRR